MRDEKRIDKILDKLREVWKANPDLRLGQLLIGACRVQEFIFYYMEDEKFEAGLDAFIEKVEDEKRRKGNSSQSIDAEAKLEE